jgi:hypothetical protein
MTGRGDVARVWVGICLPAVVASRVKAKCRSFRFPPQRPKNCRRGPRLRCGMTARWGGRGSRPDAWWLAVGRQNRRIVRTAPPRRRFQDVSRLETTVDDPGMSSGLAPRRAGVIPSSGAHSGAATESPRATVRSAQRWNRAPRLPLWAARDKIPGEI